MKGQILRISYVCIVGLRDPDSRFAGQTCRLEQWGVGVPGLDLGQNSETLQSCVYLKLAQKASIGEAACMLASGCKVFASYFQARLVQARLRQHFQRQQQVTAFDLIDAMFFLNYKTIQSTLINDIGIMILFDIMNSSFKILRIAWHGTKYAASERTYHPFFGHVWPESQVFVLVFKMLLQHLSNKISTRIYLSFSDISLSKCPKK